MADALNATAGKALQSEGQSINTFFASLGGSFAVFGAQFALFLLIKGKLPRIYQPRTFLVPERERTKAPPKGLLDWIIPVFRTSNSDFIQKCGLDAYFFLRYLRLLLKIFIPLALIILPILLPLNAVGGRGSTFATGPRFGQNQTAWADVTGLDELAWGNVHPDKNNRYWAHLILAVGVVVYTCWVFFDELRGYIRLRQAYLTSPQHRLRASATTVLVTAIPRKWCTAEALDGLYDVFPGGIRNIWINRNFDELNEKVQMRNKLALALEGAETELIKSAKKANIKKRTAEAKKAGKSFSKEEREAQQKQQDEQAEAMAGGDGMSSGNPHQVKHTLDEALNDESGDQTREPSPDREKKNVVGQGFEAFGHGFVNIGKTVFSGLKSVGKEVDGRLTNQGGYVTGDGQMDNSARNGEHDEPEHHVSDADLPPSRSRPGSEENERRRSTEQDQARDSFNSSTRPMNAVETGTVQEESDMKHARENEKQTPTNEVDPHSSTLDAAANPDRPAKDQRQHGQQYTGLLALPKNKLNSWRQHHKNLYNIPSPTPHGHEEDEFPLGSPSPISPGANPQATINGAGSQPAPRTTKAGSRSRFPFPFLGKSGSGGGEKPKTVYPPAYDQSLDEDVYGEPTWKKYLKPKDRPTMRLPIFGWTWMISLPFIGKKVDTIYYCRKEVARLNLEIEQDQREPEKFPLMNSAFIQFNHQVAAHMACQSISHHMPNQMAPRLVEISPDDVLWDNMSVKWWERYLRTAVVIAAVGGLIIGWAFPVAFTGLLSQVSYLTKHYSFLKWLERAPTWILSIIQGILPQILLALLLLILPIVLRLLAKNQGTPTGMAVELTVSNFYFVFLFIQVFLVVSISTSITTVIAQVSAAPTEIPAILASNLPKATNYFFSYLLLQALSVSAGALVQLGGLFGWFVMSPLIDNTARQKWARQITLPNVQWGTFFPVYTNLAAIGLIYSVVSPLILVFNIVTFSLFWIVYRYNTLYVTKFRFDTGGLLFPKAINHLFAGLYVMELCLIGLFFLVRDADDHGNPIGSPCKYQGIVMIVILILTIIYQVLLNHAFSPLFRYLPITLEDDAVARDEEFARAQEKKFNLADDEHPGDDINDILKARERREAEEEQQAEAIELKDIERRKSSTPGFLDPRNLDPRKLGNLLPGNIIPKKGNWADRSRNRRTANFPTDSSHSTPRRRHRPADLEHQPLSPGVDPLHNALFSGLNDEIEDLTPDERDKLVRRAFQHEALRAKRPVIWIPRDELGVSDDEVFRTQRLSKHIWISNEYTGLDGKGRVVYRRSPPDFSEVDLIEL